MKAKRLFVKTAAIAVIALLSVAVMTSCSSGRKPGKVQASGKMGGAK